MAQADLAGLVNAALVRVLYVLLVILCVVWHVKYMGGYSVSPDKTVDGVNYTVTLFNWHPLTMILAYGAFKTEAVMTYLGSPLNTLPRRTKKYVHACLQTGAAVLIVLGLVAVVRSHTQKRPEPYEDLYSVHSYVAIAALAVFALQILLGAVAFIMQLFPEQLKHQYAPLHRFYGMVGYLVGFAAILTGLQERESYNLYGDPHVRFDDRWHGPLMVIPAVMAVTAIFLCTCVALQAVFFRLERVAPPEEVAVPEEGPSVPVETTTVEVSAGLEEPLLETAGS